jgi:hypothetical protein
MTSPTLDSAKLCLFVVSFVGLAVNDPQNEAHLLIKKITDSLCLLLIISHNRSIKDDQKSWLAGTVTTNTVRAACYNNGGEHFYQLYYNRTILIKC